MSARDVLRNIIIAAVAAVARELTRVLLSKKTK